MDKILLIGDPEDVLDRLQQDLRGANYAVSARRLDNDTNASIVLDEHPNLILVAIGAEPWGPWQLLTELRNNETSTSLPIVLVISDSVLGELSLGPDIADFLLTPYHKQELLTRIKLVLLRSKGSVAENLIKCGDLVIDLARYEVSVAGRIVDLTYKEYELLRYLVTNKDVVITRDTLLARVWGYDYYGGSRTVDVHIRRLRSKLEERGHSFIDTVRNVGYRFKES